MSFGAVTYLLSDGLLSQAGNGLKKVGGCQLLGGEGSSLRVCSFLCTSNPSPRVML